MQYDIFNNLDQFFGLRGRTGTTFYYTKNSIQNKRVKRRKRPRMNKKSLSGIASTAFLMTETCNLVSGILFRTI